METILQRNEPITGVGRPIDTGAGAIAIALVVGLVWTVAIYWSTALQVVDIWWRSETFAHGLLVLPICAWLIWTRREYLVGVSVCPNPWMVVPVALAGLAWLLGQMANVNALSHAALAFLIIGCIVGLIGLRAARELSFPLGFLLFGVPIGEFLMPVLMHYTAEFTVFALRASGIPVYQEGLFFVIPSGRWSVVEACSGLRYLIASLMVGTLFAYLNYNGWRKRWIFVIVAIAVPIIANWLRAYFIVMLGHLTDNRLAAGVDHLIYGWVFFGAIILLMFWVGSFWRDPIETPEVRFSSISKSEITPVAKGARALPVLLLVGLFPLVLARIDAPVAPYELAVSAPEPASAWTAGDTLFHDYLPIYGGYRGRVYQTYKLEDGREVGLFVAYYADQRKGQELITWDNRLTIRDYDTGLHWKQVTRRIVSSPVGDVLRTIISYDGKVLGVWHWYWSDGHLITRDEIAKIKLAADRITGSPDDAAFIAVLTPLESESADASALVERFLADHRDGIDLMLREVREQR